MSTDEIAVGTRVHVTSADGSTDLGYGTYRGVVPTDEALQSEIAPSVPASDAPLDLDEDQEAELGAALDALTEDGATTPKIELDSGGFVFGFQCWWTPVDGSTGQRTGVEIEDPAVDLLHHINNGRV